jgi:hypothetical protein
LAQHIIYTSFCRHDTYYNYLSLEDKHVDCGKEPGEQAENEKDVDKAAPSCPDTEKPSTSESTQVESSRALHSMPKRKKMSNFEKEIELMCKSLNESSQKEMER